MDTGGAGFIASHVVRLLHNKYPHYKVAVSQNMEELLANFCCYLSRPVSTKATKLSLVLTDNCAGQAGLLFFGQEPRRIYRQEL